MFSGASKALVNHAHNTFKAAMKSIDRKFICNNFDNGLIVSAIFKEEKIAKHSWVPASQI